MKRKNGNGTRNDGLVVTAQAAINDQMAINRALPVTPLEDIPQRPRAFVPTDIEVRRRVLRKMADELRAEGKEAMAEAVERGDDLQGDLGPRAPAAAAVAEVLDRIRSSESAILRVGGLLEYLLEIEDIALSDGMLLLEKLNKAYKYNVELDPNLAEIYPALVKFFAARSRMVSEGMALSRKIAEAEAALTEASSPEAEAEPGNDAETGTPA